MLQVCGRFHYWFYKEVVKAVLVINKHLNCKEVTHMSKFIQNVTSSFSNVILVADRGYENYNIMAHAINKGWKFLIRIKDVNSNGIAFGLNLPPEDEFDTDIKFALTRKQKKSKKKKVISLCRRYKHSIIFQGKVTKHITFHLEL